MVSYNQIRKCILVITILLSSAGVNINLLVWVCYDGVLVPDGRDVISILSSIHHPDTSSSSSLQEAAAGNSLTLSVALSCPPSPRSSISLPCTAATHPTLPNLLTLVQVRKSETEKQDILWRLMFCFATPIVISMLKMAPDSMMSQQTPLRRRTRQEPQWRQQAWPVVALSTSP